MKERRNLRPAGPWVFLLFLCVLLAAGCSTSNENSGLNLVDAQGRHPAGWLAAFPGPSLHSRTATFAYIDLGTTNCAECHGDALDGGISKVSCLNIGCHHDPGVTNWADPTVHGAAAKKAPGSSSFFSCQICHGKGFDGGVSGVTCFDCHGDVHPHPEPPWLIPGATDNTHTNTDPQNAPVCALCHFPGSTNNPPGFPATPAPAGTPPGCFNSTLCHGGAGGANHPVPFIASAHFQATPATFASDCSNCHALTGTSPAPSAPVCQVCHTAGSPLTLTGCTSCHANPPNGAVGSYPNVAGAHAAHLALNNGAGTPVSCDTCHNGLGSGTLNHYNRANARPGFDALRVPPGDAAFLPTYTAATGPSSFDNVGLTCLNVSCHGGQVNLNWQTATLDPFTQCQLCHASGTAQFNSYNSGRHALHSGYDCTECHDMNPVTNPRPGVQNHFAFLATTVMEGPASDTFRNTTGTVVYTPAGGSTGTCTGSCHNQNHNAFTW